MMWHFVFNLLLIMLGVTIGVTLMCLMQISKRADEKMMNNNKRRNVE